MVCYDGKWVGLRRLEIGKNEGFKFGRISLKSEEKGEGSGFYFLDFWFHAAAWFGHATA